MHLTIDCLLHLHLARPITHTHTHTHTHARTHKSTQALTIRSPTDHDARRLSPSPACRLPAPGLPAPQLVCGPTCPTPAPRIHLSCHAAAPVPASARTVRTARPPTAGVSRTRTRAGAATCSGAAACKRGSYRCRRSRHQWGHDAAADAAVLQHVRPDVPAGAAAGRPAAGAGATTVNVGRVCARWCR